MSRNAEEGTMGKAISGCAAAGTIAARLRTEIGPWQGRLRHHLPGARPTLDRDVAIKEYLPTTLALREGRTTVLPRSADHAEQFAWGRERFLDEARTLARLDRTPAIVRVLRLPRSQRHRLHGDGAGRGRDAEQAPDARAAADAGGGRAPALPAARRAGGGARHRLPAPRHQAGQHHGRCPRPADADRLRRGARGHGRTLDDHDGDLHAGLCGGRAVHLGRSSAHGPTSMASRPRSTTPSPARSRRARSTAS